MVILNPYKNAQKRIYVERGIYFITVNTFERYPFFEEDVLCDLLVWEFNLCKVLKCFNLIAYKINPEHFHLMIQPIGKDNYSEIMRSIKTNTSRNINYVAGFTEKAGSRDPAFSVNKPLKKHFERVDELKSDMHAIYQSKIDYPKFQWQSSFHDHLIRNKSDLFAHVKYIESQWVKHELPENKFCMVNMNLVNEVIKDFDIKNDSK